MQYAKNAKYIMQKMPNAIRNKCQMQYAKNAKCKTQKMPSVTLPCAENSAFLSVKNVA